MREQMTQRLEALKREFEAGQRAQAELDHQRDGLTQTMLRISGAMQVLTELLTVADEPARAAHAEHATVTSSGVRRVAVG